MGDSENHEHNCALHAKQLGNLETVVNKILLILQGNGTMGVATKAELAYKWSEDCKKKEDERKNRENEIANKTEFVYKWVKARMDDEKKIRMDIYRWLILGLLGAIIVFK